MADVFGIGDLFDAETRTGDEVIAALASRQHGVCARWQLLAAGIGVGAVKRRVKMKRLHPVYRGVYAVGHSALAPRGRMMAAVLACGPGAVASHQDAAELWGLLQGSRARWHVTVPGRRPDGSPGIRVHAVRTLHEHDRAIQDRIPVTSVHRTLLDLAEVLPHARLIRAIEQSERLRLFDQRALDAVCARGRGRRGLKALRAAMAEITEPAVLRSELELLFLELCRAHGLPIPLMNVVVAGYEVDALWPEERLVVELDSYEFHGGRQAFENDRERDAVLAERGYRTLRITYRSLTRRPEAVARRLRSLLDLKPLA